MISGIEVTDGTAIYTIAPMNLRIQLDTNAQDLAMLSADSATTDERFFAGLNLLLACARRNHPQLTLDALKEAIDTADFMLLVNAVMTKSGFVSRPLAGRATTTAPQPEPMSSDLSSAQQDGFPTTSSTG